MAWLGSNNRSIPSPGQVTGVGAVALSSSSVTVSWSPVAGASGYAVFRNGASIGPHGSTSFTDTGLSPSTTYTYSVSALGTGGSGTASGSASATTRSSSSSYVYVPGNRVWIGYQNMPSFATIKSICDGLFGVGGSDPNGFIKGIRLNATWAQVEGPTLGDYSAGDTAISAVISLLKSYPIPRDLTMAINGGGNGYSSISSTAFQSSFCPAYMNAGVKGSTTDQYGGGEVHLQSDGVTPLDRPYIVIWNTNVVAREGALFNHWWNTFGPDTPTGGIYRIDPYNEMSVNQFAPGYSTGSITAVYPQWMAAIRGTNNFLIYHKPTFINPSNGASYGSTIVPAMFNNHISMGCEDCSALHDWGMKAYLGLWASTPVDHTIANGGNPDWDYHCNVDPAELWNTSNGSAAIPPARYGSGLYYDGGPTNPGIMTTVNQLKASHVDWYIDAFGGPNVVRRVFSNAVGVPPNPLAQYGGPGAGLGVVAHPNIIDVLANKTQYSGVSASGLLMPWTQYPSSYP